MTERSKVRDWKSRVSVRVPRVQIPVSPPTRFEGRKPGTVLVTAAQPRQVRKEATVSGRCGAAERLAFCPRGFTLTPLRVILNPCLMKSPRHENVLKYLSNSLVRSLSPPRSKNRYKRGESRTHIFFPGRGAAARPRLREFLPRH